MKFLSAKGSVYFTQPMYQESNIGYLHWVITGIQVQETISNHKYCCQGAGGLQTQSLILPCVSYKCLLLLNLQASLTDRGSVWAPKLTHKLLLAGPGPELYRQIHFGGVTFNEA